MSTISKYGFLLVAAAVAACGHDDTPPLDAAIADAAVPSDGGVDSGPDASAPDLAVTHDLGADTGNGLPPCAMEPCPIQILAFPYQDSRSTTGGPSQFDSYPACAPQDESGPEIAYVFRVTQPGTLVAAVTSAAGADVDLHLLAGLDADRCLRRGDIGVSAHLDPGVYYLVADSFVTTAGAVADGPYDLFADFLADGGPCEMVAEDIPRIGTDELLAMPATGKVVLEAHLMTQEEADANVAGGMVDFPSGWPTSFTDHIAEHYALSQATSGYTMTRGEPWAPCCEPSNDYGQGSSARPPAAAEAWYINMRWRSAPARGERYLVLNPATGKAVVAAAGYENGPGDVSRIGGACEEIHDVMGTGHLDTLTFGKAVDQSLPYGPIECH